MPRKVKEERAVDQSCSQVPQSGEQVPDPKPWLRLKGSLPKEVVSLWRSSLEALSAPDEQE